MSLEQAIKENTEAVRELIAALGASGGKAGSGGKGGDDEGGKSTTTRSRRSSNKGGDDDGGSKASKYTVEQVKAAAVKVKDELGTKAAKQLIKDHGADELAALKPEAYEDFINACEKALNAEDGNDDDSDSL